MNRLNCFIKTFLLTCVVIACKTYAFDINNTANDNIDGSLDKYNSTPPEAMVKIHNIVLTIENNTDQDLVKPVEWFNSGRLGDGWEWPKSIPAHGGKAKVELTERDWAFNGCSGYVDYTWGYGPGNITFSFSNPDIGTNKVDVGVGGMNVWYHMSDHGYKEFTEKFQVNGIKLKAVCSATPGAVNKARVVLSNDDEDKPY